MNNEFKKLKNGKETRYTLESMTAGATGSGSIATATGTVGKVQKRGNILAQEAGKEKDAPKPRNFVAKNAKMGGAGKMKDKSKTLPRKEKHKKPVAEGFNHEYDDEAGMAQSNLLTSARAVMGLLKTIKDRDNLPEWGQEKIAKAEMMLVSVWDYLQSQKQMGNDPQQGVAEGNLKEFAPDSGGGESGRWYSDDQMTDIVGDGWWNDLDVSGDIPKRQMIQQAQAWLNDQGYSVQVLNCKLNDDDMDWYIEGSFQNPGFAKGGMGEGFPKDPNAPKLVQDRKTGKWYDPNKEFDKKMNSPEVMAQMKRMAQKEGVEDRTSYQVAKILSDRGIKYDPAQENDLINAIGMVLVKELNMTPKQARYLISYDEDFVSDTLQELGNMESSVSEVAPPGWEKTVKAMKKHDNIDNPFALAWSMKNKGYKSHKKESVDPYFESLANKLDQLKKK